MITIILCGKLIIAEILKIKCTPEEFATIQNFG